MLRALSIYVIPRIDEVFMKKGEWTDSYIFINPFMGMSCLSVSTIIFKQIRIPTCGLHYEFLIFGEELGSKLDILGHTQSLL